VEHQTGEGHEMKPGDRLGQAFVVLGRPPEAGGQGEGALDDPPPRQQHEARFASGSLTTSSRMPCAAAAAAGSSPVYPWSTQASSTGAPVASRTAAA
jgi:hypothetical protein